MVALHLGLDGKMDFPVGIRAYYSEAYMVERCRQVNQNANNVFNHASLMVLNPPVSYHYHHLTYKFVFLNNPSIFYVRLSSKWKPIYCSQSEDQWVRNPTIPRSTRDINLYQIFSYSPWLLLIYREGELYSLAFFVCGLITCCLQCV
jgi:hypothetical protein